MSFRMAFSGRRYGTSARRTASSFSVGLSTTKGKHPREARAQPAVSDGLSAFSGRSARTRQAAGAWPRWWSIRAGTLEGMQPAVHKHGVPTTPEALPSEAQVGPSIHRLPVVIAPARS